MKRMTSRLTLLLVVAFTLCSCDAPTQAVKAATGIADLVRAIGRFGHGAPMDHGAPEASDSSTVRRI